MSSRDTRITEGQSSKYLLRQLIQTLTATPKRDFVRTRINFDLKIAVGLNTIYALITENNKPLDVDLSYSSGTWPDADTEQSSIIYTTDPGSLNFDASSLELEKGETIKESLGSGRIEQENTMPDWASNGAIGEETVISGTVGGRGLGPGNMAPSWVIADSFHEHDTFPCKTINESAGGYCINWHGAGAPQIKVGEILGVQSASGQNQFAIGITRWMKNGPKQHLQIGVQVIAPNSLAIQVRPAGKSDYNKIQQGGLLLPELKAAGQPATLVIPTLPFKVGNTLWIDDSVGHQMVRLTRLLESTGAFSQFQFIYLHDQSEKEAERDDGEKEDFDNIWSMI